MVDKTFVYVFYEGREYKGEFWFPVEHGSLLFGPGKGVTCCYIKPPGETLTV